MDGSGLEFRLKTSRSRLRDDRGRLWTVVIGLLTRCSCCRIEPFGIKSGGASRRRPGRPAPSLRACGVGAGPYAPDQAAAHRATPPTAPALTAVTGSAPPPSFLRRSRPMGDEADGPIRTPGPVLYRADDPITRKGY
jgi:hypothetical protein